jgi:hypothetical protein
MPRDSHGPETNLPGLEKNMRFTAIIPAFAIVAVSTLAVVADDTTKPATPDTQPANTVYIDQLDISKAKQDYGDPAANKTVEGNDIKLKDKTFTHAFGTHANSVLVIDLKGAAKTFTATVGVDDDVKDQGSVRFHVIGDGKELAKTGVMKAGEDPKNLTVDVTGIKQLELKVDDADDGIDYDHADWADAKLELLPDTKDRPETVDADKAK